MSNNEKSAGGLEAPCPNPLGSNKTEYYHPSPIIVGSDIYDNTPDPSVSHTSSPPPPPHPGTRVELPQAPQAGGSNTIPTTLTSPTSTFTPLRPFHHLAYKVGSESPMPQDLPSEICKATRILRAFTTDPAYPLEPLPRPYPTPSSPSQAHPIPVSGQYQTQEPNIPRKNTTLLTIPPSIISSSVGLAIFTSVRVGLHASVSTGSGILIARLPDGSWGPPSAISIHSLGFGFLAGMDVSEVVYVVNTHDALEAFKRARFTVGPEVGVAAGPWGVGGGVGVVVEGCKKGKQQEKQQTPPGAGRGEKDAEDESILDEKSPTTPHMPPPPREPEAPGRSLTREEKRTRREARKAACHAAVRAALNRPVYAYVRSRGLYAGLQVDGTMVTERGDANAKFYGMQMCGKQILNGYVPPGRWIEGEVQGLYRVLRDVEGRAPSSAAAGPPELPPRHGSAGYEDGQGRGNAMVGAGVRFTDSAVGGEEQSLYGSEGRKSGREGEWEELPKYENDGIARPGVGDFKGGADY
ncbi:hypothetical protein MKZ38_002197 [Zalerion maritima]|uniref:Ysc84 actin-binding domain-containing protein n=1 Tax=Zalerion maritima TaxID=339359 RepID=A0AAD5RQN4_9PEZI|nr:hypothetical protein MKZ38_002197 [Zalerion maritima]